MDTNKIIDIIALIGGFILAGCLIPQIYKSYKTKNVHSISIYWQLFYIIGLSFTNIYTYYNNLTPIFIPGTIELFFIILLLIFKIKYSKYPNNTIYIQKNINNSENINENNILFISRI